MTRSVDFVTNVAPHYRAHLWLQLLYLADYDFRFFFGVEPDSSIRQINFSEERWPQFADRLIRIRNFRVGNVLVWQSSVVWNALRTDSETSILLGDMYVLSTWLAAFILKFRRRAVVFWGHGLYGNEGWLRKRMRLAFLRLASTNLVYGERAKGLLVSLGFASDDIRVMYNSLDYFAQSELRSSSVQASFYCRTNWYRDPQLPVLIFVGRLTRQKRLEMLIDAVDSLNREAARFNLLLVGAGPERELLETRPTMQQGAVHFYGACYDERILGRLIANADLCVSPGEIGLTAVHALSYGTPACTHDNFSKQMPEVEAIIEGETGCFFSEEEGNLAECIDRWFQRKRDRGEIRSSCFRVIDRKYNPDVQCKVLREVLDRPELSSA